jgi:hypothetical protein
MKKNAVLLPTSCFISGTGSFSFLHIEWIRALAYELNIVREVQQVNSVVRRGGGASQECMLVFALDETLILSSSPGCQMA